MTRRGVLKSLAALAFAAAAACFGFGLAGVVIPWLVAMGATLALLTTGFHLAIAGSARK